MATETDVACPVEMEDDVACPVEMDDDVACPVEMEDDVAWLVAMEYDVAWLVATETNVALLEGKIVHSSGLTTGYSIHGGVDHPFPTFLVCLETLVQIAESKCTYNDFILSSKLNLTYFFKNIFRLTVN